jgi:putative N6-adenine-specific DNA methylase
MYEVFNNPAKVIITCNKRLAIYLQQEVEALGFKPERVFATGIELKATVNQCIKLNLNLRCASQILYRVKEFTAADANEMYNHVLQIEWEKLIDFSGYFSVTSNVDNPTITTPLFANLKVKDAIADRIKSVHNLRPNSGSDYSKNVVHLYWKNDNAEIYLNTATVKYLAKHPC